MLRRPYGQLFCIYQDYEDTLYLFMLCSDGLVVSLLAITKIIKMFFYLFMLCSDDLVVSLIAFTKTIHLIRRHG